MSFGISNDDSTQEILNKYPVFREFCDRLHGSGIDYDWTAEENKNYVFLFNAFHVMNDCGMYVTSQSFKVAFPKKDITEFKLTCCDKSRYWWNRNMLEEVLVQNISFALSDCISKLMANGKYPIVNGLRDLPIKYEVFPANPSAAANNGNKEV